MADNKLNLLIRFDRVDKLSAGLKTIVKGGKDGHRALAMLKGEAKQLDRQLDDVRKNLNRESGRSGLVLAERELQAAIADTNRQIERQTRLLAIDKSADKWAARGDAVTSFGQKATLALTAPLAAGGFAALKFARDFNDGLGNIQTVTSETDTQIREIGNGIKQISRESGKPLGELTSAYYDMRSAGVGASTAMFHLKNSAKLAIAGLGTTQGAVDLATSAINGFQLSGEKAGRVYNLLFKTVKNGKTTAEQLAQGFGGVASTVSEAGIELDEFLAATAAMTTTGLPAAQTYSQLKAIISGMTRETKIGRQVFNALGAKDFPDLIQKSGGFVNALEQMKTRLGGSKAAMLEMTGSTEGLNAWLALTGAQSGSFRKALGEMRGPLDELSRAFDKKLSTDAGKLSTGFSNLSVAAVDAGTALLPVATRILTIVGDMATRFSNLSPETQGLIIKSLALTAAIGPLAIGLGSIIKLGAGVFRIYAKLKTVSDVAKLTGNAVSAFSKLRKAFLSVRLAAAAFAVTGSFPLAAIGAIVVTIGAAAYLIYSHWDKIKAAFSGAISYIGNLLSRLPRWVTLFAALSPAGLLVMVVTNWAKIKTAFWDGVDRVKSILTELPGQLKTIGLNLMSGLLNVINPFALADRLLTVAKNGITAFKKFFGIKSPSRLMMEMGGYMSAGLSVGLDRSGKRPVQAMKRIATGVAGAGALALSPAAIAAPGSGSLQPAQTSRTAQAAAPVTININIYQQPGQDAQDLARQVADMIRRQRADLQRRSFTDDF